MFGCTPAKLAFALLTASKVHHLLLFWMYNCGMGRSAGALYCCTMESELHMYGGGKRDARAMNL